MITFLTQYSLISVVTYFPERKTLTIFKENILKSNRCSSSVPGVARSSLSSFVALIENSVKWRWVPPHHFPRAVGGRVYFPLSAVYVNEKRTGLQADR